MVEGWFLFLFRSLEFNVDHWLNTVDCWHFWARCKFQVWQGPSTTGMITPNSILMGHGAGSDDRMPAWTFSLEPIII